MKHVDFPTYVCGHSPREFDRLERQAAYYEDITRSILVNAGIRAGMHVLDIGCGGGDLSFLVTELVGPNGTVLGIDRAPQAIAMATERASRRELQRVSFRRSDIDRIDTPEPVDALVGRFVLMHQADPTATLRRASRLVRPGGMVVMMESHLLASIEGAHSHPTLPTYDLVMRWMVQVIRAAGAHPDMGFRLREVFLDAGLPEPALRVHARADGGADAPTYAYVTESVQSMLPMAREGGLDAPVTPVEDLEHRLRQETTSRGGVLVSPYLVGAWCRLP